ncbi:mannan endo-1,6-alpha-mannosidase DCW1 [Naviculisporaceae sp. PSN 640]
MLGWGTTKGAGFAFSLLVSARLTQAYVFDPDSDDSIKTVASSLAQDLMSLYDGDKPGGTPGLLPPPYFWWEAGALMGALVDYWLYTGDTTWVNVTQEGLLFQTGPNDDYMPLNQTMTEGNDDQGFWGLSVMSAAEYNFPNPPSDKPQWLALAQAVFNTQASRWDPDGCGGGLRWQIFTWNSGYEYKNSISQACFFNLAARLARYTGNQSYADWAERTWDWMEKTDLIAPDTYYVYDGIQASNCSEMTPYQWTYNAGAFLVGASAMYNYTTGKSREVWRTRLDGLLNGTMVFFRGPNRDIMSEVACEPVDLCDTDQQSFKAYLSRWMAATIKWAPWTSERILPVLRSTSIAALSTCKGGPNGRMCGLKWTDPGKFDGSWGVGQQMAVMEVVLSNLIHSSVDPFTDDTGGTSIGDPAAGGEDMIKTNPFTASLDLLPPITSSDRIGAGILTTIIMICLICGCVFVLSDEKSEQNWFPRSFGLVSLLRPRGHGDVAIGEQSSGKSGKAATTIHRTFVGRMSRRTSRRMSNSRQEYVEMNSYPTPMISAVQGTPQITATSSNGPRLHQERRDLQTDVSSYWDRGSQIEHSGAAGPSQASSRYGSSRIKAGSSRD